MEESSIIKKQSHKNIVEAVLKMTNKPKCKLIGTDGNVFALAGKVSQTLNKANQLDKSREFQKRLFQTHSYDEALALMMEYVEVS